MFRTLILSTALFAACHGNDMNIEEVEVEVELHSCATGDQPYIVSQVTPFSWEGSHNRMVLFSSRDEDAVSLEGDDEAFGYAEPGDRVCVNHDNLPDEGPVTDFTVTSVEDVPDTTVVCTIDGSFDLLEWAGVYDGEYDSITGVSIGAEGVTGVEETDSYTITYIRTWWYMEVPTEVLADPTILSTDDSPPYEEFPVSVYEYRLQIPETLVDIIFCLDGMCLDDMIIIDTWSSPTAAWFVGLDRDYCHLEP